MKHELEIVVGKQIASATNLIAGIRATVAGTLEKVTVFTKGNVSTTQTFDINKGTHDGDLSTVFSNQTDRPSITSGNHSDEATPTSTVSVALGDLLTVDADVVNETIELVTIIFTIEDNKSYDYHDVDAPYSSPSTEDDEFTGTSMAGKWTATGTANNQEFNTPTSMFAYTPNSGNSDGFYQTISDSTFIFRAKFHLDFSSGTSGIGASPELIIGRSGQYWSLTAYTNRSSSYQNIHLQANSRTALGNAPTNNANTSTASNGVQNSTVIYLEVEKTSTQILFRYSFDGRNFATYFTTNDSNNYTQVGFVGRAQNGGKVRIDWFRRLQGTQTGRAAKKILT